jgi:uncharacterized repeat protein (TIGR01451 family)
LCLQRLVLYGFNNFIFNQVRTVKPLKMTECGRQGHFKIERLHLVLSRIATFVPLVLGTTSLAKAAVCYTIKFALPNLADLRSAHRPYALVLHALLVMGLALPVSFAGAADTSRVSVSSSGAEGNGHSRIPTVCADGRLVAFFSEASNLVPGDTNGELDIFIRDALTKQTTRISVDNLGVEGNGASYSPSISADCRFVGFVSSASNLVPGDTNGHADIFIHDLVSKKTIRMSVDSAGMEGNGASYSPSISADGRFVTFLSEANNLNSADTNNVRDVFLHDRVSKQTTRVSVDSSGVEANALSYGPSISADGRFVAFGSLANNLVPGDTNGSLDVFVRDRISRQITLVSVYDLGVQANQVVFDQSISADGRFVAFSSRLDKNDFTMPYHVFVRDRATNRTTRISVDNFGLEGNFDSTKPSISADGRFVVFDSSATNLVPADANGKQDIFMHDRHLSTSTVSDLAVTQKGSYTPIADNSYVLTYTATIKNLGAVSAANVNLLDFAPLDDIVGLPPHFTLSQGSCYAGPISVCRLGTLAAGQEVTVEVAFRGIKPGQVSNRVIVNAAPFDPMPGNNIVSTTVTVDP